MRFSWASPAVTGSQKRSVGPISICVLWILRQLPRFFLSLFFPQPNSQGGNPDVAAAARIVLRDWSTGKLSRYAVPPAPSSPGTATGADAAVCPTLATIYAGDAALLERLSPRRELRRTRDLVRLSSERIDDRALALETPWFSTDAANGASDSDGGEGDDDDAAEVEKSGSGSDEEEDADEAGLVESAEFHGLEGSVSGDEDEDGASPNANAHSSSARKRKPSSLSRSDAVRPPKKVSFAGIPTRSKKQVPLSDKRTKTANSVARSTRASAGAARTRTRTHKPAANAPSATAQKRAVGEDGAYDFSKFF